MPLSDHIGPVREIIDDMIKSGKYIALFTILKAFRQGVVYGTKVRAPHALVLNLVWGSGPLIAIPRKVFQVTKTHAMGLALSSVIYTLVTQILKQTNFRLTRESGSLVVSRIPAVQWWHAALGGFLVGYFAWGDYTSGVHMQMMMYIASRLLVAMYLLISEKAGFTGTAQHYRIYSGLLWATLMTILCVEPAVLQASMRKSLEYVFLETNRFTGFRDLFICHKR